MNSIQKIWFSLSYSFRVRTRAEKLYRGLYEDAKNLGTALTWQDHWPDSEKKAMAEIHLQMINAQMGLLREILIEKK